MATNQERAAVASIAAWCKKQKIQIVGKPRHIYPRAYVLGRPSVSCLVVACPPVDAEPQIKDLRKAVQGGADGSTTVQLFDGSLKAGDWCSVAYISTASGSGQRVAVPIQ